VHPHFYVRKEKFMAHLIENMAYVGDVPWHQLGNALPPKQPIEVWAEKAGMDWSILETPVCFMAEKAGALGSIKTFPDQKVLFRSDSHKPLSVVSERYQVVQPREVLEFYRDLTEISGYELETAGVMKEGKKFWALARTGKETVLKGNDCVKGYLLLATSCDGTLEAQFWAFVETDQPPPADGSDSADQALRCLYPRDAGHILNFAEDSVMSALFSDLVAVRQTLVDHGDVEARLRQRIQERMGDATRVIFETGEVSWKRSKDSTTLDIAALKKDYPELLVRYTLPKPGSRRFLVNT
jgi:hypothetical protein